MTADPLGPALAAELGGEWEPKKRRIRCRTGVVECRSSGTVWLRVAGKRPVRVGTFSDGVAALAAEARRLGVA